MFPRPNTSLYNHIWISTSKDCHPIVEEFYKNSGIINYRAEQRFGTSTYVTTSFFLGLQIRKKKHEFFWRWSNKNAAFSRSCVCDNYKLPALVRSMVQEVQRIWYIYADLSVGKV